MNKVLLMGRLTRNPEVKYTSGAEQKAVARYTLAVNRKYKKNGEQEADFIPCVAFGKNGEFAEKYLSKGQLISVVGRLQVHNWEDNNGNKRITTEVIVEEHYFAENKKDNSNSKELSKDNGFYPIDENEQDEDLPF